MGKRELSDTRGSVTAPPDGDAARDQQLASFVEDHARTLFRTAFPLTSQHAAAEDLLQDVLAALFPKWHLVMAADHPVAYVRRALANRFISSKRRAGEHVLLPGIVPESDSAPDHADAVAASVTVWPMLHELPDRQRAALVLRYFHGWTDVEIAAALDCRRGTARSLVSRGLDALRSALTPDGSGPEIDPAFPLTDQEVGR